MKFYMFVLVSLFVLNPGFARAACEDGAPMAESEVLQRLRAQRAVGCRAISITNTESDGEFEEHLVEATCQGVPLVSFQVSLQEFEDAVCSVHHSAMIANTGYPGMTITRTCARAGRPGPTFVVLSDSRIRNRGMIEKQGAERGRFFSSRKASGPILSFRFFDGQANRAIVVATDGRNELQTIGDFGKVIQRERLVCR